MASILIATAVMFLLGLGLIGYAVKDFSKKNEKKSWAQTTGEIIQSNADDIEEVINRERFDKNKHFGLDIRYTYMVNLTSYESSKVSEAAYEGITGLAYSEERVRAYAKQYQTGTKVTVYYDPENPENSILKPNAPVGRLVFFILMGISILICGLSLLMLYYTGSSL